MTIVNNWINLLLKIYSNIKIITITHFDGDLEIFLVNSAAGVDVWNIKGKNNSL